MKTLLIKLQDKFILVSNEEIKEGDYMLYKSTFLDGTVKSYNDYQKADWNIQKVAVGNLPYVTRAENGKNAEAGLKGLFKIIAGIPELPSIDFSLLSKANCKTIGWVDVEKLCPCIGKDFRVEWINGFKTAQALNDKIYSLEQVRNSFWKCFENRGLGYSATMGDLEIELSKSLQQSWDVEVEMERNHFDNEGQVEVWYTPKITNNSIKIKVLNPKAE